jgi:hypothetical protein
MSTWKGTKGTVQNISELIASLVPPATNSDYTVEYKGNDFKARPNKHYRKQYTSINTGKSINNKNLGISIETPGGTSIVKNDSLSCDNCTIQRVIPNETVAFKNNKISTISDSISASDYPDLFCRATDINADVKQCVSICDPEQKALQLVRSSTNINTNPIKPRYYQSNREYLRSRCRTYKQNSFTNFKNEQQKKSGEFDASCCECKDCKKTAIYKPNNEKFAVQGAVSSSSRIDRLKLDTVNKFASGFKNNPNFGPNVANAYSYSGNYQAPFTVKNKMNNCKNNVRKYRRNIQCPA